MSGRGALRRRDVDGMAALRAACAVLSGTRRRVDRPRVAWEPGDLCWWWRTPRATDAEPQPTWWAGDRPVAAVRAVSWDGTLGIDVLRTPDAGNVPSVDELVSAAVVLRGAQGTSTTVLLDRAGDAVDAPVARALEDAGWTVPDGPTTAVGWLRDPPVRSPLPDGLRVATGGDEVVVRADHLARRSGVGASSRLRGTPRYDPDLVLVVLAGTEPVAYAHGWLDRVSGVGLVEPVRVEDDWQRRGIATALVADLAQRLQRLGAGAVRIGWVGEDAGRVYARVGVAPAGVLRHLRDGAAEASRGDPGASAGAGLSRWSARGRSRRGTGR